jgi:diadenosine tetraphosphate (Ap4A) HIT family hydrolase
MEGPWLTGLAFNSSRRFSHNLDEPVPPRQPTGPCWFCLSSPDVATHLVVSVGEQCYCALAKGPIMQGHVLLLPVEHYPSTVSLPGDTLIEMQKYKQALRTTYESQGNTIIAFERYIQLRAGTHAHLQVSYY